MSGVKPARGGFDKDTRWVRDTLLNEETRSMKEFITNDWPLFCIFEVNLLV